MRIWKSLYDGIYRIIDVIMIVSLIVMVLSVFTNVFFRYFDHAFTWVDEVSRFAFVWLCFSAFVAGMRRMMHPAFTMISDRFTGRSGQVYRTVILGVILVFTAFVLVGGAQYVYRIRIQKTSILLISVAWQYSAVPIMSALMLVEIVKQLKDTWFPAKEGSL